MRKIFKWIAVAAVALAAASCTLVVEADPTRVQAQNDLYNLVIDYGAYESDAEIDLNAVVIGDVAFGYIAAGDVTAAEETSEAGSVNIYIGSADVTYIYYVGPLLLEATETFSDIDPMATTIDAGELNTVVFDETTAEVILN
jgi:hypothetical protein